MIFHTLNGNVIGLMKDLETVILHTRAFLELTKIAAKRGHATECNGYLVGGNTGGANAWCYKVREGRDRGRELHAQLRKYVGDNALIMAEVAKLDAYYAEAVVVRDER
jgi:hypothetical protein